MMLKITKTIAIGALLCMLLAGLAYAAAKKRPATGTRVNSVPTGETRAAAREAAAQSKTQTHIERETQQTPSLESSSPQKATVPDPLDPAPAETGRTTLSPNGGSRSSSAPATYGVSWQAVNMGGAIATSATYESYSAAGEPAIGEAAGNSYGATMGYMYGLSGGGGCQCPYQSDFDADNFVTPLDLAAIIDILFAGAPDIQDPGCVTTRADFDCDLFSTPLDLSGLIDYLFASGSGPCDPCQ
jgi:hypothetical protein